MFAVGDFAREADGRGERFAKWRPNRSGFRGKRGESFFQPGEKNSAATARGDNERETHLRDGGLDVARVGGGHGLAHDGVLGAELDVADGDGPTQKGGPGCQSRTSGARRGERAMTVRAFRVSSEDFASRGRSRVSRVPAIARRGSRVSFARTWWGGGWPCSWTRSRVPRGGAPWGRPPRRHPRSCFPWTPRARARISPWWRASPWPSTARKARGAAWRGRNREPPWCSVVVPRAGGSRGRTRRRVACGVRVCDAGRVVILESCEPQKKPDGGFCPRSTEHSV